MQSFTKDTMLHIKNILVKKMYFIEVPYIEESWIFVVFCWSAIERQNVR